MANKKKFKEPVVSIVLLGEKESICTGSSLSVSLSKSEVTGTSGRNKTNTADVDTSSGWGLQW